MENKTPELKKYQGATFSQRLYSYNLDITLFILAIIPLAYLIENNLVLYTISFFIICAYHAVMESSSVQGTLGKKMNGLRVVNENYGRISFWRALLRIICKFISLVLGFAGFFMIYFRKDRKGLHDIIARTRVVSSGKV